MFRIACQKMWHKKWMNLSLLVGCILLIGTIVSFPVYENASYDRMLQDEFVNAYSEDGKWPTLIKAEMFYQKDKSGTVDKMDKLMDNLCDDLKVTKKEYVNYYSMVRSEVESSMKRSDAEGLFLRIGSMKDFENHISIVSGEGYEGGMTEDGYIKMIVSENCLVSAGILVGEKLCFKTLKDVNGENIKIQIVGVYECNDRQDNYWQVKAEELTDVCFMDPELFRELFCGENIKKYTMSCEYYMLFEYDDIRYSDVDYLYNRTNYYIKESAYRSVIKDPAYMNTLDQYLRKINRISATLIILQVPVVVMLCAFLLMISGQMYEMEKNEISVIKSRGSSRIQIFMIYLYQSMILMVLGIGLGVPLSLAFSKVLGGTRNFLTFDLNENFNVSLYSKAYIYAACGALLCILSLTIPAIKHSRVSIVNLKRAKVEGKKPLWQKLFLDFICIGIAGYGYYSFNKNMTDMSSSVLAGESLDPLLYVSSSLFILGLGLLFLRLQPYIVKLIYRIGSKFWNPGVYVSFMENIRSSAKMALIMLFLIMTVSLGIYHASVARTILSNALDNTEYLSPADIIIKENWTMGRDQNGNSTGYVEPDFTKYQLLDFADGVTKVLYTDAGYIAQKKNDRQNITLMGIHTKEFGNMTSIKNSLNSKSYHSYLNELASEPKGILVSRNFNSVLGYEIGDSITYHESSANVLTGTIVDFVDYFPGFAPTVKATNADGSVETRDNYLIVANYDVMKKEWGAQPYEIWIDLKDSVDSSVVYDWIEEKNLTLRKYVNREKALDSTLKDPLLQGTNGVLTLSFVVTLILCGIGYLIYWVMALKERELMFGILRASGMHKYELLSMLITEQIFTGVFSVFAGIGIGLLTSKLFVPIIQQAYSSEDQVLPMELIRNASDLYKLYGVVAFVMLLSLLVLSVILFKMNVTKALKLGEE